MEKLKQLLISKGLDENLVNFIQLSEGANETQILEAFNSLGKLPTNLQDLDSESFTELKNQIQNAQNSKIGELRTKWENDNKVIPTKNEGDTTPTTANDQTLEILKGLQAEIEGLKGSNQKNAFEIQRSELLKKHNINEKFHKFLVGSPDSDITQFENTIKEFAETSQSFVNEKISNSNQTFIHGNKTPNEADVPKSVVDAFKENK